MVIKYDLSLVRNIVTTTHLGQVAFLLQRRVLHFLTTVEYYYVIFYELSLVEACNTKKK
jgi:hypothetical protein